MDKPKFRLGERVHVRWPELSNGCFGVVVALPDPNNLSYYDASTREPAYGIRVREPVYGIRVRLSTRLAANFVVWGAWERWITRTVSQEVINDGRAKKLSKR